MAVSKTRRLPNTPRTLWETVVELQREFKEFRAQRTLEASAIGNGGLTVQDPAEAERMLLTPHGTISYLIEEGDSEHFPPGMLFYTGDPAEISPGELTAYSRPGEFGRIPVVVARTADLGNGVAVLELSAGNSGGEFPTAVIDIGAVVLRLDQNGMLLSLSDGTDILLSSAGATFASEGWNSLTLANGWTATGGTWLNPFYGRQIDGRVQLIGSISPGTLTAGTTIATIPTSPLDYGPPGDVEFRVPGGSATAYCDLVIHASTGQVTITNVAGTITRLSLSGISYPLD